jgi:hypothetical protein
MPSTTFFSNYVRGLYWAEPSALFRSLGKERLQLWLDLGAFAVGTLNLLRVVLADRHGQVKSLTALLTYVFIDRHRITSPSTAGRSVTTQSQDRIPWLAII